MKHTIAPLGLPALGLFAAMTLSLLSSAAPAIAQEAPPPALAAPGVLAAPGTFAFLIGLEQPSGLPSPGGETCRDGGPLPADRGPGGAHRPGPEVMLPLRLATLEVIVGIRAEQLDAWRDYTDALLAVTLPPALPVDTDAKNDATADPFARAQRLAEDQIARGQQAAALEQAIQVLREKLTPEQLGRLQAFESKALESREAPSPR